jgi:hypothetical protein
MKVGGPGAQLLLENFKFAKKIHPSSCQKDMLDKQHFQMNTFQKPPLIPCTEPESWNSARLMNAAGTGKKLSKVS